MKEIFIVLSLSLLSLNLFAQDKYLKNDNETKELSKKIVSLFSENKISESFDHLSP